MKELNEANFDANINAISGPFIIKFYSPTCGPCKAMNPVFDVLERNNPNVPIFQMNTSENPELADRFGIRGVPHIAFCEEREVLYTFTGTTPLGNLQFVLNNINDPLFRETGEFQSKDEKKNYLFEIGIILLLSLFVLAFVFM